MNTYEDFLKETIYSKELNKTATFMNKDGKTYICCEGHVIEFPMHYEPKLHPYLKIAAVQALEVYYMLNVE